MQGPSDKDDDSNIGDDKESDDDGDNDDDDFEAGSLPLGVVQCWGEKF